MRADCAGFVECAVCSGKSGTPYLCSSCLTNRSTIHEAAAEIERLRAEVFMLRNTTSSTEVDAKLRLEECRRLLREACQWLEDSDGDCDDPRVTRWYYETIRAVGWDVESTRKAAGGDDE